MTAEEKLEEVAGQIALIERGRPEVCVDWRDHVLDLIATDAGIDPKVAYDKAMDLYCQWCEKAEETMPASLKAFLKGLPPEEAETVRAWLNDTAMAREVMVEELEGE